MNKLLALLPAFVMASYPAMGTTYYVNATGTHTHTVIFLHHLGGTGNDVKWLFENEGPLQFPGLKAVLPTAPV